jgi:pentatricopeptide repeat protein
MLTFKKFNLGYVENNIPEKALDVFEQMHLKPEDITYAKIFSACAQLADDRAMKIGKKLFDQMQNNFRNNTVILTSAICMLMKFGDITHAEHLFELIKEKDIVTYISMMNGYNINNQPLKCLKLFGKMKQEDILPNEVIFTLLIGACSQIGMLSRGQSIVDQIPLNFYDKPHIYTSLIDMWVSIHC